MSKFTFLKVFLSPFKRPKIGFYFGPVKYGVPMFFPRKWIKNKDKSGYLKTISKKFGFDFVNLGWKTKWSSTDYRFEYSPIWSFVFFKWQLAITFKVPKTDHYWECYLYYTHQTKGKVIDRIKTAKKEYPCIWIKYFRGNKITVNYWDYILKDKYTL